MKVTFPHMGNMYIPVKVLLDTAGIDYVMPPSCNKKTLEYGLLHSPEFVCLPFKTILGDFIHGIENGADTILFGGGCGQCRLGYFADLHNEILKSIGYNINFYCLDLANMTFKDILNNLTPLTSKKSKFNIYKSVVYALKTLFSVDTLYQLSNYTRCREVEKGRTDTIMRDFHLKVKKLNGYRNIAKEIALTKKLLNGIAVNKAFKPLKVAIVGEIYAAVETYLNLDIEKKLGNMGVEVHNKLGAAHWIKEHFVKTILPLKIKNNPHEAGKEFMNTNDIGGHGLETIGNSILCAKNKYDGVIHIYPFTCMPEIIAQSTFSDIQEKYKIPIMTLIIDEMTGEGGYTTRIEAFVDMLQRRSSSKPKQIFKFIPISKSKIAN